MPGTVLGTWDKSVNEAKVLALIEPTFQCGEPNNRNQQKHECLPRLGMLASDRCYGGEK